MNHCITGRMEKTNQHLLDMKIEIHKIQLQLRVAECAAQPEHLHKLIRKPFDNIDKLNIIEHNCSNKNVHKQIVSSLGLTNRVSGHSTRSHC